MTNKDDENGGSAGGYGKPPKEHQFKPGQSGNPKGRPRGPGSLHKMIMKHAAKKVSVIENGMAKTMPKMEVVIAAMFNSASQGDVAAARLLATQMISASEFAVEQSQSGYGEADLKAILDEADWQAELVKLRQEKEDDAF